ncbi:hypothetical protein HBH98_013550 [Parastagonospora nodorum]|nr:hypothetical protein HBH98_013550 [Parastagonospora nodorum]KAH4429952.1 hypothetical protein HBH99_013610 [Parastagonospora nodorum]KAH5684979.1 hypothetical protein HBI21_008790 [Parastagonospora nodorum]
MSSSTKQQNTMMIVVRLPPNPAYADSKISKMGFLTLPPEDPPAKISASSNPACRSVRVSSKLRGPYHTQIDIALSELVKYARNVESARILGHTDNFTLTIGTVTVMQLLAPTSKRILPGCRHPGLAQDMCALPQLIALIACRIHIVGLSQEASFLLLPTLTSSALENRPIQQFWIIVPRASVLVGGKLPCWKSTLISLSPRSLQGFWPVRISYNRLPILNTSPSLLPCPVPY